jgi:hypothetical protein
VWDQRINVIAFYAFWPASSSAGKDRGKDQDQGQQEHFALIPSQYLTEAIMTNKQRSQQEFTIAVREAVSRDIRWKLQEMQDAKPS